MKYNRADFSSTCKAAKRASEGDGRLRFVHATALGFAISTRRTEFQDSWWTNGTDCGPWAAFAPCGQNQREIAIKLADELQASL